MIEEQGEWQRVEPPSVEEEQEELDVPIRRKPVVLDTENNPEHRAEVVRLYRLLSDLKGEILHFATQHSQLTQLTGVDVPGETKGRVFSFEPSKGFYTFTLKSQRFQGPTGFRNSVFSTQISSNKMQSELDDATTVEFNLPLVADDALAQEVEAWVKLHPDQKSSSLYPDQPRSTETRWQVDNAGHIAKKVALHPNIKIRDKNTHGSVQSFPVEPTMDDVVELIPAGAYEMLQQINPAKYPNTFAKKPKQENEGPFIG